MDPGQRRSPRGRVLVVDDDAAIRELLTEFLEQQDFEVQIAPDGSSGLAAFGTERFDLLLVDFQMPGMTGVEMAAEVRRRNPTIPIALITGSKDALVAGAVAQAGINQTFTKPFNLGNLANWIASLPL
jgi:two-component system response regulator MtrA